MSALLTVIVTLHREGHLARASLASALKACRAGFSTTELSVRANGLFTAITILLTAALLAAATALAV